MITYPKNTSIALFTNYVDGNGLPVVTGISGNTVDVYHYSSGGTKIFDLVSGTMTQDASDLNRFYYIYPITGNAATTNYIVEYSSMISGNSVQLVEAFGVSADNSSNFPKNISIALVANYTDQNGSPVLSGISGTTVDVYHYGVSGTKAFDLVSGTMLQDADDMNRFYYIYSISGTAPITNYIVEYSATHSGSYIQGTDVFGVSEEAGVGSVLVSGIVVNASGSGIDAALVNVSIFPGTSIVQFTSTVSGNYFLMLNPGDYVLNISASGYASSSVFKTVPDLVPTFNFGTTTLYGTNMGSIQISDTYVNSDQIPLSGLRVSLFNKGSKALNVSQAIAVGYTNGSGTFALNAEQGRYVLLVEGTQPDNMVFQTAYDIDVDPVFTSSSSTGFRYLGTSQYSFLI